MRSPLVVCALLLGTPLAPGCVQLDTGTDAGSSAKPAPTTSSTRDAGPGGSDCLQASGAGGTTTLCAAIDTCPGVAVDRGAYPDCGFRMGAAGVLDLECFCSDQLCPVGVASSCQQAAALLDGQSELTVCQQVSEERCVPLGGGADAGGTGGGGTCDPTCRDGCGGDPSCLQLCGC